MTANAAGYGAVGLLALKNTFTVLVPEAALTVMILGEPAEGGIW